jgi:hypothetical protein
MQARLLERGVFDLDDQILYAETRRGQYDVSCMINVRGWRAPLRRYSVRRLGSEEARSRKCAVAPQEPGDVRSKALRTHTASYCPGRPLGHRLEM